MRMAAMRLLLLASLCAPAPLNPQLDKPEIANEDNEIANEDMEEDIVINENVEVDLEMHYHERKAKKESKFQFSFGDFDISNSPFAVIFGNVEVTNTQGTDSSWSGWSEFGPCSATCGAATKKRQRKCSGDAQCPGANQEIVECTLSDCGTDGGWSDWSEFGSCSATCGSATKRRVRTCTEPAPPNGGKQCSGSNHESFDCALLDCDGGSSSGGSGTGTATTIGVGSGATTKCTNKVTWTKKSVIRGKGRHSNKKTNNGFDKYEVFGVPGFCEVGGDKTKCQHMLSLLAAYIDNDNDGCPDNPPEFLNNVKSWPMGAVILTKSFQDEPPGFLDDYYGLTMWEDVTNPSCSGTLGTVACADASLEEVFHLLTDKGYGPTWPKVFGLYSTSNSNLTRAMDIARNPDTKKPMLTPPWVYPASAWWKHPEADCVYDSCQTTEYHWAAYASLAGITANSNMLIPIFTLNTKEKLKEKDPLMYAILMDTKTGYKHPVVAPTGTYTGCAKCQVTQGDTTSHGGSA